MDFGLQSEMLIKNVISTTSRNSYKVDFGLDSALSSKKTAKVDFGLGPVLSLKESIAQY